MKVRAVIGKNAEIIDISYANAGNNNYILDVYVDGIGYGFATIPLRMDKIYEKYIMADEVNAVIDDTGSVMWYKDSFGNRYDEEEVCENEIDMLNKELYLKEIEVEIEE